MDPVTLGALITAGSGIIGGIMQNQSNTSNAREATQASREMSWDQMQFQERMSSTAYQRSTTDMLKAGINPILAVAPASSPTGASGTATVARAENILTGAAEAGKMIAEKKKQQAEIALLESQKKATDAGKRKTDNETALLGKEIPKADLGSKFYNKINEAIESTSKNWRKLKSNINSDLEYKIP